MGWTWYPAKHYKNGKIDKAQEVISNVLNLVDYDLVKYSVVGSRFYGAVRRKNTEDTYAVVVHTKTNMRDAFNFGYKLVTEFEGPVVYDCPKGILALLSPTDSQYANAWRQKCLHYHESKKNKVNVEVKKDKWVIQVRSAGDNGVYWKNCKAFDTPKEAEDFLKELVAEYNVPSTDFNIKKMQQ